MSQALGKITRRDPGLVDEHLLDMQKLPSAIHSISAWDPGKLLSIRADNTDLGELRV